MVIYCCEHHQKTTGLYFQSHEGLLFKFIPHFWSIWLGSQVATKYLFRLASCVPIRWSESPIYHTWYATISSSTKSRYGATATHAGSSGKDSFQLHTRLYRLQLLPRGFEIKRLSQKLQFSVPDGHQILLHTWCNQLPENIELTCFLGLGSSAGFSPDKPYFILIQYIPQENLLVSDGAFITLDDPVKVSNYLLEHTFSSPIRIPLEEMNDLISVMLPTMLEQQGHTTIHTLMCLANYYRY